MRLLRALLPLVIVASPAIARAEDGRLTAARRQYEKLDYEKCIAILAGPPPATATDLELADAELLAGVCQFEVGHPAESSAHFHRALRLDARAILPPYSSPKMVKAFEEARADVHAEALRSAPPPPPPPAPPPTIPPPPAEHAHRPPLASVLLAGGALCLAGVGTYGYVHGHALERDANRAHFESDAYALGDRARSSATLANVGILGGIVLAAAAAVVWIVKR